MSQPSAATLIAAISIFTGAAACAQAPPSAAPVAAPAAASVPAAAAFSGPAWADPANWRTVKPIETDNIIYATVPHITNPSAEASPNPGVPGGIRPPLPNTGPPGTMDMHLDVYQVPSGKPTPVLIQLHGGGWIRGDRPNGSGSFGPYFFAGISVVAVQYRNAIDAPAPAAVQDVLCAMAWVKKNAAKYNFDPNEIIPWGGSAGGHLALMAGYAPASMVPAGCTDQPKVAAVLDDFGPTNLEEGLMEHGSKDFTHQWVGLDLPLPPDPNAAPSPNGRPPEPRWPDPTPAVLARAREASPMTYVHPGLPPTFIFYGDHDTTVDPTQSTELKAALDAAHVPNGIFAVIGGGHGSVPAGPGGFQKSVVLHLQFLHDNGIF